MIWFACKKCSRRMSRPDSQGGSLVYCDCGQSVRVPWESDTVPDAVPVPEAAPPRRAAPPPTMPARPVPMPETRKPARPSEPLPPAPPSQALPGPARRPAALLGKINPNFCFQHDDARADEPCSVCRLPLCHHCVVMLKGEPVCGPCKNFRFASLARPARVLPAARYALGAALTGAPAGFLLALSGVGLAVGEGVFGIAAALCLAAAVLPMVATILSARALREIDARAMAGGRGLAASGLCVGLATTAWCLGAFAVVLGRFRA